jgi:glycosyltransferase involved in cell wall biosynthesis
MSAHAVSVSVIIPSYNRLSALGRAIRSAECQTYQPHEIIVVDDASDYPISQYLKEAYRAGLPANLHLLRNPTRKGGAACRNLGASLAKGEAVAFLDSDDFWLPQKLEKQVRILQLDPTVGLVSCDLLVMDHAGTYQKSNRQLVDTGIWERLLLGWTTFPNTSSLVLRRDVFTQLGGFDEALTSCQDHDLWMRLAKAAIPVKYAPEALYVVTHDAPHRISVDYERRMAGVDAFLKKWHQDFRSLGTRHARKIRQQYLVIGAFESLALAARSRQIRHAWRIFSSHFALNPAFYRALAVRVASRLRPRQPSRT